MTTRALILVAAITPCIACVGPRAPSPRVPYSVRLVGAEDGALRRSTLAGHPVFEGSTGRDYGIEVTNDTPSDVGMTIVIDGLDGHSGRPVTSCEELGGWELAADSTGVIRGFSVSKTQLASHRFAPRDRSLAAITQGARREAIGTIEVCFFSLKARAFPAAEGEARFDAVVESEKAAESATVTSELRDEPATKTSEHDNDKLVARIVLTYVDESGARLGTAPPPAGIARVAPREREREHERARENDEAEAPGPKGDETKRPHPDKPVKPYKGTKPPRGPKGMPPDKGK